MYPRGAMDRVAVIANPVASQFTGGAHRDVMAALARRHNVEALWPGSAAEATTAAQQAVEDRASLVVAMGGDGMVHHVAQGLVGTEAALGIIPAGTTNVIARLFGLPSRPVKAARLLAAATESSPVGVVQVRLVRGSTETTHYSLFACGFGLDAEVVRQADQDPYRKYRFGSVHYARTALGVAFRSFPSHRPHALVRSADRTGRVATALIQFRPVYTYFGRIPIRISSRPPSPMTVLLMDRLRRRRIPRISTRALLGRELDALPGLEVWEEVGSLDIEADPPIAAQADGESLGLADAGEATWLPGSLRVVARP